MREVQNTNGIYIITCGIERYTDPPLSLSLSRVSSHSYRRNNPGLEQAIIGTELLRLAGGPNRGWYPTRKANQPRPASIEHLERLNNAYDARLPGTGDQRKPLTLPTNITPNKYFGQSKHSSASSTREALRRVTSLLIKKGKRRGFALLKERKKIRKERNKGTTLPFARGKENTTSSATLTGSGGPHSLPRVNPVASFRRFCDAITNPALLNLFMMRESERKKIRAIKSNKKEFENLYCTVDTFWLSISKNYISTHLIFVIVLLRDHRMSLGMRMWTRFQVSPWKGDFVSDN